LGCGSALFGVGDQGVEARVAVQGLEIRIISDAKFNDRVDVLDCLAQKRHCLISVALACHNASKMVCRHSGIGVLRAKDTAPTVKSFVRQLLCLRITTFFAQDGSEIINCPQGFRMLGAEDAALDT
jgi:hypothetical protein